MSTLQARDGRTMEHEVARRRPLWLGLEACSQYLAGLMLGSLSPGGLPSFGRIRG